MKNWIKGFFNEFEITPKDDNWDQIAAALDRKEKRRFLPFMLLFLVVSVGVSSYLYLQPADPSPEAASIVVQKLNNLPNSNLIKKAKTPRLIDSLLRTPQVSIAKVKKQEKYSLAKAIDKKKINEPALSSLVDTIQRENKVSSMNMTLSSVMWLPSRKPYFNLQANSIEIDPPLFISPIAMGSDTNAKSHLPKKSILTKLKPSSVYTAYQLGRYVNTGTLPFEIKSTHTQNIEIGVGYLFAKKLEIQLGFAIHQAKVRSSLGERIELNEVEYTSIGLNTSDVGLNETRDTLILPNDDTYASLRGRELYLSDGAMTFRHAITSFRVPISLSYQVAAYGKIYLKARLGCILDFQNQYTTLDQLPQFEVSVQNKVDNAGLRLGAVSMQGGLLVEYRPRQWGAFVSTSFSTTMPTDSRTLFTDYSQTNLGLGLSYYLGRAGRIKK